MSSAAASLELTDHKARAAGARSRLYGLFSIALGFPHKDFYQSLKSGELGRALMQAADSLPFPLKISFPREMNLPDYIEFQSRYISFFELGLKSPPCPLYEGALRDDQNRRAVMEELIRFYEFFDLKMNDKVRELPDYLNAELEFMHYLAFLEARLREEHPEDPGQGADLVRAQRDFLERHLAVWVPALSERTKKLDAPRPYPELLSMLSEFILADLRYLENLLSRSET